MRKVQSLELENIARMNTGDLMARLVNDVNYIQSFLSSFSFSFILNGLTVVVLTIAILAIHPRMALIGLSPLPLLSLLFWWVFHTLQKRSVQLHRNNARVVGQAQRMLTGLESIKAYGRDDLELSLLGNCLKDAWAAALQVDMIQLTAGAFLTMLGSAGPILILWYGGNMVLDSQVTLGILVGINALVGRLIEPVIQLSQQHSQWQVTAASADRYYEVMDLTPSVSQSPDPIHMPHLKGQIRLENVTVDYGRGPVLHKVSLEIAAGETVALIGPNGGGKSTLSQLILRFIDPTEGRVLIDGVDLTNVNIKSLRSQCALVNQLPLIFDGTVFDNLRYGRLHATKDEMIKAAHIAGFHEFAEALPQGYDTVLQRGGATLSAGQRQRLALARAILREPSILVLDEATSSLDVPAEEQVYARIRQHLPTTTLIIVAHRPWVTAKATKLAYVERGRIIGLGTHHDLLRTCLPYHRLCVVAGLIPPSPDPSKLRGSRKPSGR